MYSSEALYFILKNKKFNSVLDVGSGSGLQAEIFKSFGKTVTCVDIGRSDSFSKNKFNNVVVDNFNDFNSNDTFDLVWCSHILEHQRNIGLFLEKCYRLTSDCGHLCITVPPFKHNIVGGHLTVWNMGLLLYNMVISGIDCSKAQGKCYGYNISVIVSKLPLIDISKIKLSYDNGDLEKLKNYFPFPIKQNFDGNIKLINWDVI